MLLLLGSAAMQYWDLNHCGNPAMCSQVQPSFGVGNYSDAISHGAPTTSMARSEAVGMRTFNHGSPLPSEDGETHMQCTEQQRPAGGDDVMKI